MRCLVTGASGFIGSNLTDQLLSHGHNVIGYDNFSTGRREFLDNALAKGNFQLVEGDILDKPHLASALDDCDIVYHMAANADIRGGIRDTRVDLEQNTLGTHSVLEAMREVGCRHIAFASSSAVYGNASIVPTPENLPMPVQISLYGASKLAGEGLVSAYCEAFDFHAQIFRFVSVLGERYTHGHVFDFVKQLRSDNSTLTILGNGLQRKSYMDVRDCVSGIMMAVDKAAGRCEVYNLGPNYYVSVNQSVDWICSRMQVTPKKIYSGGDRGWIGDSPFVWLDPTKIMAMGWEPKVSIESAITSTVDWLIANLWAMDRC